MEIPFHIMTKTFLPHRKNEKCVIAKQSRIFLHFIRYKHLIHIPYIYVKRSCKFPYFLIISYLYQSLQ